MKTYKLKDGGTITATSPEDFLTKLRESSKFDSDCTDEQYMQHFAERYKTQEGVKLKTDNPTLFFSEVLRVKYIEEIQ